MFDALLTEAKLSVQDVRVINLGSHEHAAAYRNDKVDAVVTFEPVRTKLLAQGAQILFDSSQIPGRIVDVMVVRPTVLDSHSAELKTLIAAHFKVLDYLDKQPQVAATYLAPYLGVTPQEVMPQFVGLKQPGLVENHELLSGTTPPLVTTAKQLAALMVRQYLLEHKVDPGAFVDARFLPNVRHE